jgi:hypothetical protein
MGPFPEERWSSLAEMRAELEAFVAESTGERPRREERQPKVVTILPAQSRRAGDEEQTRVVRRDPQPSLPPVAGARASSTSEMVPARQSPAWLPALWAFAGAAVTAILFLVLRPGAPPPAAPAPARDTPPVTIVVPAVEPVVAPAPVATPAPVGAPAPAPAPTPTPVPPPSGAFDPEDIGRRAASVLESCFTPARLGQPGGISMGATLIFNPKSATAAKIYFAAGDGLSVAEHRCAKAELMGVAAGSPPAAGTVVEYGFRLKPGKADVRHKLVK